MEPSICIGSDPIKRVRDTKILGVYIDESLTWSKQIEEIAKTITAGISALKRLGDFASRDVLVSVYNSLIMPHFDYCCEVWDSLGSVLAEQSELALRHLGWSLLSERRFHIKARQMFNPFPSKGFPIDG